MRGLVMLALLLGAADGRRGLMGSWARRAASTIVIVGLSSPLISLAVQTPSEAIQAVAAVRSQLTSFLAKDIEGKSTLKLKDLTDLTQQVDKSSLRQSLLDGLQERKGTKDAKSRVLFHGKSAVEDLELIEGYGLPEKEQLDFSSRALNAAAKELGLYLEGVQGLDD